MSSIEDRLRESLRDRATDVEPTPQLWERVQKETRRRAQLTWLFAGLSVAVVVGALTVAIPAVLDDDALPRPGVLDTPPADAPSDQQTPTGTTGLGVYGIVTTDGEDIVVRDVHGVGQATLLDLDQSACECEIAYIAVSPQSTDTDVLVVYTVLAEGRWEQRWLRATGNDLADLTTTSGDYFLDDHAITSDTAPASTPAAAFSPDGEYVAWVEMPALEAASPMLRVVGFGTQGPTDVTASYALTDLPNRGYAAQDWNRDDAIVITTYQEGLEAYRVPVRLHGNAVEFGAVTPLEVVGGRVPIDIVDVGMGLDEYLWAVEGSGEGSVRFSLTITGGPEGPRDVPLPAELAQTSDPSSVWMTAEATTVLLGQGGRAWLIDAFNGNTVEVPGTASAGAFVGMNFPPPPPPPGEEQPTAPPTGETAPTVAIEGLGDVVVRDGTGRVTATLYDSPCTDAEDCEFRPARLAVRPGSTIADLTVLVLWLGDGAELGWISVVDGEPTPYTPFPQQHQISASVVGSGSEPVAVWSSDGRHIAWIEEDTGTGTFGLRTVGWSGGPGTGRLADDNASWEIDTSRLGRDLDLELDEWGPWTTTETGSEVASFTARWRSSGGEFDLAEGLWLERQSDGALALVDDSLTPVPDE
ncbi:MAG: hypothetical protein KY469_08610 [Actinobacteria bacterium]|nr:hypothetical protein [Actinomycetota bacterium]